MPDSNQDLTKRKFNAAASVQSSDAIPLYPSGSKKAPPGPPRPSADMAYVPGYGGKKPKAGPGPAATAHQKEFYHKQRLDAEAAERRGGPGQADAARMAAQIHRKTGRALTGMEADLTEKPGWNEGEQIQALTAALEPGVGLLRGALRGGAEEAAQAALPKGKSSPLYPKAGTGIRPRSVGGSRAPSAGPATVQRPALAAGRKALPAGRKALTSSPRALSSNPAVKAGEAPVVSKTEAQRFAAGKRAGTGKQAAPKPVAKDAPKALNPGKKTGPDFKQPKIGKAGTPRITQKSMRAKGTNPRQQEGYVRGGKRAKAAEAKPEVPAPKAKTPRKKKASAGDE